MGGILKRRNEEEPMSGTFPAVMLAIFLPAESGGPLQNGLRGKPLKPTVTEEADRFTSGLAFSPNGELLAAASGYWRIRLFDTKTGKALGNLDGDYDVSSLAFSIDGKTLVAGTRRT